MTQQQPELLDLYRAGLKSAVGLVKTSLERAERMQNQQLAAIRSALDEQARSVEELGQARSMDELMAVQTRMAGAQVERMLGYWTRLYENQMTAIGEMQSQMVQVRQWLSEAAAQTQDSAREAEATTARAAAAGGRSSTAARRSTA